MKNNTTETKPLITWTNYRGEWMIRSTEKLTPGEFVEVSKKNGGSSEVKVGEYERCFKNPEGDSHIYSICNI